MINWRFWFFFHGLEGSSNSQYCLHAMGEANRSGWLGVVAHFRGCSGEPNRLPRSYHSGDSEHADIVLREIRKRFPEHRIFAVGVSLGGNALTKWCGEQGEHAKDVINAAASVCSPLDLGVSAVAILHFQNRIFNRYFMKSMGESFAKRMRRIPSCAREISLERRATFPSLTSITPRRCMATRALGIITNALRLAVSSQTFAFLSCC